MRAAIDLQAIRKLPKHLQGAAFEAVATGRKIRNIRVYAQSVVNREDLVAGWVSLDAVPGVDAETGVALQPWHERLAAPAATEIERWRTGILDDWSEALLTILSDGAACMAGHVGRRGTKVTKRRAQQIVADLITRVEAGDDLISASCALGIVRAASLQGGRDA